MNEPRVDTPLGDDQDALAAALAEVDRLQADVERLQAEVWRLQAENDFLRRRSDEQLQREFDAAVWGFPSEAESAPGSLSLVTAEAGVSAATGAPPASRPRSEELPTDLDELRGAIARVRADRERSEAALLALLGPEPRPRSAAPPPPPSTTSPPPATTPEPPAAPSTHEIPEIAGEAPTPTRRAPVSLWLATIVAAAGVVVLGGYLGVGWWSPGDADSEPATVPPASLPAPASMRPDAVEPSAPPLDAAASPAPPGRLEDAAAPAAVGEAGPGVHLTIAVTRPAWLRVLVDGNKRYEGSTAAGEVLRFEGRDAIVLRSGDAGAVSITLNGVERGPLGRGGEVVTRSFLADAAEGTRR